MNYLFYFIIFLFGSAIGSFLNVVILRLCSGQVCCSQKEESIIRGRSHCPKCGQTLAWHDLLPVLSFFILRGRCRYCQKSISWQYPLVEITTGLLFALIFYLNYESRIMDYGYELSVFSIIHNSLFVIQLLLDWFIISGLVIIFVYDLRHFIIPDKVLWPAIIVTLAYRLFIAFDSASLRSGNNLFPELVEGFKVFYPYLLSAFGAAAFFLFLVLITRGRGMGIGDIKLAFLMGLLLGWPGIFIALFLAFFIGAAAGVLLMILGKKTMKSQIPFGPFLVFGTIAFYFAGEYFLDWLSFFIGL